MGDLIKRNNEIDFFVARAKVAADQSVAAARRAIEDADELLAKSEAIRAARRRRLGDAA